MNSPEAQVTRKMLLATDLSPAVTARSTAQFCGRGRRAPSAQLIAAGMLDPAQAEQYAFDQASRSWNKLPIPLSGCAGVYGRPCGSPRAYRAGQREMARETTAKLAGEERVAPALRERLTLVVERWCAESALEWFVEEHELDLTMIGSQGQGCVFDAVIGGTSRRLVDALENNLPTVFYSGTGE